VAQPSEQKIKKSADTLTLELLPNPDILAYVANLPQPPFCVGFAAETEQLETAARAKLAAKNVDLIAANLVGASEGGFGADENRLLLVDRAGSIELPLAPKTKLARTLIQHIANKYNEKNRTQNSRRTHRQ